MGVASGEMIKMMCPGISLGAQVVKDPVVSAGEPRFHPCSRKIPHATGHLNPCATSTEAHMSKSLRSATREATAMSSLHTTTREQPQGMTKTECTRKCGSRSVVSDSETPMDYTVHGILQARILQWVAVPFSRGNSQPRDQTQVSCIAGGFFPS